VTSTSPTCVQIVRKHSVLQLSISSFGGGRKGKGAAGKEKKCAAPEAKTFSKEKIEELQIMGEEEKCSQNR